MNNENHDDKPNINSLNPNESTESQEPLMKNEKGFSVIELLIVLLFVGLIGFVGWYVYQHRNKTSSVVTSSTPVNGFYYTDPPNKVVKYNPLSGEKSITTLPLSENRIISSRSAGMNMNVQLRDNGHKIFYLSEKPKAGAIMGGEGEPERDSTIISVFENDKETKLVELKATTGQSIVDWLVSPDSTKIYYLTQDSDKGNINLHMLSISDKKDTVIKANLAEPGTINNPLFMTRDRTLLIYSGGENYELTEHKVTAAGYSKRDLRAPCKCILNYPQAISPNGKKLLLKEQTSGEAPSDFIYHVLDTLTNKNTKIAKSTTNEQWASSIWSPNSDSIFYSTASFGDTPSTFKPRLEMIGINNKKPKSVIKDELRSKDQVSALSWSPDGRYLVYSQNDKVRFYDMETGKILSNSINSESFATSDKSFGWY